MLSPVTKLFSSITEAVLSCSKLVFSHVKICFLIAQKLVWVTKIASWATKFKPMHEYGLLQVRLVDDRNLNIVYRCSIICKPFWSRVCSPMHAIYMTCLLRVWINQYCHTPWHWLSWHHTHCNVKYMSIHHWFHTNTDIPIPLSILCAHLCHHWYSVVVSKCSWDCLR